MASGESKVEAITNWRRKDKEKEEIIDTSTK